MSDTGIEQVKERRKENLRAALLPIWEYLISPDISDIMINEDGNIWIKSKKMERVGTIKPEKVLSIIRFIASMTGHQVTYENPDFEGSIPYPGIHARISATIEPWTSTPTLCIRNLSKKGYTLLSYVNTDRMTPPQFKIITEAIKEKKNIILSGATGSGKTSLLNAILDVIAEDYPQQRVFTVEDTAELHVISPNSVSFVVPPEKTVKAVRKALRYFPERIIFGELRYGDTTLELLKAWNTGHPGGISTIHANDASSVISRLSGLLHEVTESHTHGIELIKDAIDVIIHVNRGARVAEIKFIEEII